MLGILTNNNIKSVKTDVNNDGIKIEMKLKKSILEMSKFGVFSAIFDFDDFIKSLFITNDKSDYSNINIYEYELLTNANKNDKELLFTILYDYILSFKNKKVNYNYYGYYNKKITSNILITYKADKNKIGIKISKNILNKDVFDEWE